MKLNVSLFFFVQIKLQKNALASTYYEDDNYKQNKKSVYKKKTKAETKL